MRTFTYSDAKSHKFWNIDLQGNQFTVTYGRIGAAGQSQTKEFADAAKAQKEHDKLVKEKLAKGYVETTPSAQAPPRSLREALEEALAASPDDLASHMAYADWLSEQPAKADQARGELIRAQLALEDEKKPAAERKKLQQQEEKLLKAHEREWLGSLAEFLLDEEDHYRPTARFARGWLDSLEVGGLTVPFARVLAKAPQTRLLRRLSIEDNNYEEDYEPGPDVPDGTSYPGLYPLLQSPYLGNVRVLQVGPWPEGDDSGIGLFSHCGGEGLAGLVQKMPALEELYVFAHAAAELEGLFGWKDLTRLRVLQVYHCCENAEHPLATLAGNASLGRLTHLLLHPHAFMGFDGDQGSSLPLEQVRALVQSPHLNSLTHLQLRLSNMGDEGCRALVASGILKRLKVLDLRHGCITDEGARALAACPDLKNLELLDVGRNWLTQAGTRALEAVGIKVQANAQSAEGDEEWLSEGDWE
jgi:uncharacterized protein (TIGR02996 family)